MQIRLSLWSRTPFSFSFSFLFSGGVYWDWISIHRTIDVHSVKNNIWQMSRFATELTWKRKRKRVGSEEEKKKCAFCVAVFWGNRNYCVILNFVAMNMYQVRHTVMFNNHTYTGCQVDCVLRLTFRRQRLNIIPN